MMMRNVHQEVLGDSESVSSRDAFSKVGGGGGTLGGGDKWVLM